MDYEVNTVELHEQMTLTVRGRMSTAAIPVFLGGAFSEISALAAEQGAALIGPPFGRYTFEADGSIDAEIGFPAEGRARPGGRVTIASLPGGVAARTMHVGSVVTVERGYDAIENWLVDHDYVAIGAPWERYLDGPDVAEPRTEIFFPCQLRVATSASAAT
jgi:effector-binding domain-containing protein